MQLLRKILWWVNILIALSTLLTYLSPLFNPQDFWQLSILGIFYPLFLLLNVLFLIFWAFQKNKNAFLSLLIILLGWNHLTSFFGFHINKDQVGADVVKVLQYNVGGKRIYTNKDFKQSLKSFLIKENPSVLCIQEFRSMEFYDDLPEYQYQIKKGTATLLSKYPFTATGGKEFSKSSNGFVWADININGETIRVYSVHLQSSSISPYTDKFSPEEIQKKEAWQNIRTVAGRLVKASKMRADQVKTIAASIKQCPHPVILCGDFNDPPVSYTYRVFESQLKDHFKEKGTGFGVTYSGKLPGLRIDYIMSSESIKVKDHYILEEVISDHYPVISLIEL